MKKYCIFLFIHILILSGCSTQKLYTAAINYERSSANFSVNSVQTDFGKIVYLENDIVSATTLVLLHGFGGDKDNWNRFTAKLNAKYHVIAPDIAGFGESKFDPTQNYTLAHQTEILTQFLNSINVSGIHIVGNSMGGAMAVFYAANHPDKVKSLTLMSPAGITKVKSDFQKYEEKTGKNPMLNVCSEKAFDELLSFGMHKRPYIPGLFMDLLVSEKCARSDTEETIYKSMLQDLNLSELLTKVTTPTLIIWGKKDRVLHVDNARIYQASIKGSQLEIFEDIGHVPLIEDPEKIAQFVAKYVNSIK